MTLPADAIADPSPDDLHCPVCDYALRGLSEPRCPECGYAFEWEELRKRQRLKQGWFYEHSGTFRSHLKTRWKSLWPWSFWRQVHAYTDADPRRLWRYRLTSMAALISVGLVCWAAIFGRAWMVTVRLPQGKSVIATTAPTGYTFVRQLPPYFRHGRVMPGRPPSGTVFNLYYQPPPWWARVLQPFTSWRYFDRRTATLVAGSAVAVVGVVLMLPLYWRLLRASVLRANVRQVHLARVDAYSTDVLPLVMLPVLLVQSFWTPGAYGIAFIDRVSWGVMSAVLMPAVVVGVLTVRLAWALRRYVRFPQATAVALAYGLIAGLAWTTMLLIAQFP